MYQCNGCGTEVEKFGKLCEFCSEKTICQSCGKTYLRGTGWIEHDICSHCQIESSQADEEFDDEQNVCLNPYEEYGFDYPWEL